MSIIHDALKKVQKDLRSEKAKTAAVRLRGAQRRNRKRPPMMYIIIPLLLLGGGYALWGMLGRAYRPEGDAIAADGTRPFDPVRVNRIKASLELNGIFFSGDKGYCLINNQILAAGDVFDGIFVREITPHEVTLEKNGRSFTLSTD
ncbi:MAG: hypothetical protein MJA29_13410 [Candidatus Omnitrophica bacterium]|nr:hypothetical protein [Candidatus Omnitrophota bacterium]